MRVNTFFHFLFYFLILLLLISPACKKSFVGTNDKNAASLYTQHQLDSLTLSSIIKVDDYPLYVMTYYGDYGFDEYLKTGQWSTAAVRDQNAAKFACTCFAALNADGEKVFGRNFDWRNRASMLLFTDPPDVYSSVAMVDLAYFGFPDNKNLASGTDQSVLRPLLQTPYLPFDGLNEHGLAIGMMAVQHAEPPFDPQKVTIGEIEVIRLALDYAKNVNEAIRLIKKYNVRMDDPPIHYLISDKTGQSVIIEFVNKEMKILRNTGPWQVSTNFVLSEYDTPETANCRRYNYARINLQENNGNISTEEAMSVLEYVSQSNTMWSMVYNMSNGDIYACTGGNYDTIHKFSLFKSK